MHKIGWGVVLVVCAGAGARAQPFRAASHAATYDEGTRCVLFEIEFNREPDFHTIDPMGNQAESFQLYLDTQPGNNGWGGTSPYPWETIVRGTEIYKEDDIRVRDHTGSPSTTPTSGGWGRVAGAVPYDLAGPALAFTVPYSVLGTTTGAFAYQLEVYRFGQWNGLLYSGQSAPIPSPPWASVLGLAAFAAARRRR
ncbi:MAG: hypothetical protein ACKVU4_05490 [Phycisphaerales bacterium]